MKKNIEEILKSVTPNTPLEEIIGYCDTLEDFELIFSNLLHMGSEPVHLSEEIMQAALSLVKTNKLNTAEISTAYIQRNLPVTYSQAAALIEWLRTSL